jgi:hypothetical protein
MRQLSIEPVGHGAMQSMQKLHFSKSTTTLLSSWVIASIGHCSSHV